MQAKIELYGLFCALHTAKVWLIGLKTFTMEVNAKYICGMLNKPDIQPNAAMNRWITGITTFDFTLKHVAGTKHLGPDRLSRQRRGEADSDDEDPDDVEDWIDKVLGCGIWLAKEADKEWTAQTRQGGLVFSLLDGPCVPNGNIPSTKTSLHLDDELHAIHTYLDTLSFPSTTHDSDHAHLAKCARHFFV